MPHPRSRYAESILRELLAHSPVVGVLGQRQVGKTTLSDANSNEYATLDVEEVLRAAEKKPDLFLQNRKQPFTIDECQYAPPLFPALKEWVRKHPKKGQFILTGSVRFTSRKAIRESLTGRIVNLELLPFSPAEAHGEALPKKALQWIQDPIFSPPPSLDLKWIKQGQSRFNNYLNSGGLPGICFFREDHVRASRFESHLETLLERDIRLLIKTSLNYRQLKALTTLLAKEQGQPLNYSALARKVGVSPPSVRNLISAMEAMFLVRTLATENQNTPVLFFEDQGLASYLLADQKQTQNDLTRGLFSCLLPQFLYRAEQMSIFFQYRTRGGAKVDIAIRTRYGTLGIIPVANDRPTPSSIASARSFLAHKSGSKVIIAHLGTEVQLLGDSLMGLPFPLLISDGWT